MTVSGDVEVFVPAPLEHQEPAYNSPARFKLLHHGRRWGKDRLAFTSAIVGHGPWIEDEPLFAGVAQGWWVGWVVRDYTQGVGIWLEEFLPRFEPAKPHVEINKADFRVTFPGGGGIFLCTDKNLHSLRGLGKRMKGLVINEAAHLDLFDAWNSVLRALLVDNVGWAIIMSTPNCASDGNPIGLAPSYFNRLCLEVRAGSRGSEWAVFGGDLRENPTINRSEAQSFLNDLTPGSIKHREEGLGELVSAAAGLAFPEWDPSVHLIPHTELPPEARIVLGMDWGIRSEAVVLAGAVLPKGRLWLFREWAWTDKDAFEAGADFGATLLLEPIPSWPEWLVVDSAMSQRTGVGGKTILQEFQAGVDSALRSVRAPKLPIMPAPKGPGSRESGYNQVLKMLRWGPKLKDGTVPATQMPLMQIVTDRQGRPSSAGLARDLASLPRHPMKHDDVETEKSGLGHYYDAARYLLSVAFPLVAARPRNIPVDEHPGILPTGQRRSRVRTPEVEAEEARIILEWQAQQEGLQLGGRYGPSPRRR